MKKRKSTTTIHVEKKRLRCKCNDLINGFPSGCNRATLSSESHKRLVDIFHRISGAVTSEVSWGDGNYDHRTRCYGFLKSENDWSVEKICEKGIALCAEGFQHDDELGKKKHDFTLHNSCVDIFLDVAERNAVSEVITLTNIILQQNSEWLKPYELDAVNMNQLISIQPNNHHGETYLPLHLDSPRHDGFGIVIATVCLEGKGDIVLVDEGDADDSVASQWKFSLNAGEMYVLSGPSRNLCMHGVLVKPRCKNRISLNFRFGLHTSEQAEEDIDRHWQ